MYALKIKKSALNALEKLPYKVRCQIHEKLAMLCKHPERSDLDVKKLKGFDLYRLRSGDYRIIYQKLKKELVIFVLKIGDRKEIYR